MSASLDALLREVPLPAGRGLDVVHREIVQIEQLCVSTLGLGVRMPSASGGREWITGSAGVTSGDPEAAAYFELLERTTMSVAMASQPVEVPRYDRAGKRTGSIATSVVFPESSDARWQYSRSNGMGAGRDFTQASRAAMLELTERDRVLRCWYGLAKPRTCRQSVPGAEQVARAYRVAARLFSSRDDEVSVAGVFALPTRPDVPLVCGFGGGGSEQSAVDRAAREAWQSLAFLWGEEIPKDEPEVQPTAAAHQERYLWPGSHCVLEQWLNEIGSEQPRPLDPDGFSFADITPPELTGRARVVRALHRDGIPLTFGSLHPQFPSVPNERAVHPVS